MWNWNKSKKGLYDSSHTFKLSVVSSNGSILTIFDCQVSSHSSTTLKFRTKHSEPQLALMAIKEAFSRPTNHRRQDLTVLRITNKIHFQQTHAYDETFSTKICIDRRMNFATNSRRHPPLGFVFTRKPKHPIHKSHSVHQKIRIRLYWNLERSKKSFAYFVKQLSKQAAKFGIKFPVKEIHIGKSVDFLELTHCTAGRRQHF